MTLLTEDEAKKKFCVQTRARNVEKFCAGSGCMAWRDVPSGEGETFIEGIKRYREENHAGLVEAKTYVESHPEYRRRPVSEGRGYCGLAGRPS